MNKQITLAELLLKIAEENEIRKILEILEKVESLEEAKDEVKKLLK